MVFGTEASAACYGAWASRFVGQQTDLNPIVVFIFPGWSCGQVRQSSQQMHARQETENADGDKAM